MKFDHIPVLFEESINALGIKPDGIYVDGTAGGGGHSRAILERLSPNGRLISIDQDPDAVKICRERLGQYPQSTVVHDNFSNIDKILSQLGIESVDGVLLDIGVSSHQLDTPERGFSFHHDAYLDMRMSQTGITAAQLIAESSWQQLAEIFSKYGEEKFSAPIAKAICRERENQPITSTLQLADIISASVPAAARRDGHPARKVFQALRIAVNGELDVLERGMDAAFSALSQGGRLAVITFHSLEARIVKQKMVEWCRGCTCPPQFPVCVCGNKPKAELLFRKAKEPTAEELENNPRSRSSRLRACIKL